MPIIDDIAGLRRILTRSHTIAVVGLSAQWHRPSYFAAKYMQEHGYRIIPVNPNYDTVLGERCYPQVTDIPEAIDIVDCFRKHDAMVALAHEAVAKGAHVLWMQLGIRSPDAARIAETYDAMARLARARPTWCKLSAPYRIAPADADDCARQCIAALGPGRVVWGSDWPFTRHERSADYGALRERLGAWAGSREDAVLWDNAARLYRFR